MDEISYWVFTKRAPCLMNYDNLLKQREQDAGLRDLKQPVSISDDDNTPPPPKKKKKKKLSLLDDDSGSDKVQGNVYFDSSNQPQVKPTILSSCKSSDVEFNIKKVNVRAKPKRKSLQKNNRPTPRKKNVIVSSTPKISATTAVRRSLRNSRKGCNESFQLNDSFDKLNGTCLTKSPAKANILSKDHSKYSTEKVLNGDKAEITRISFTDKVKNESNLNGKYEDLSDVSGFTANYIRSTKLDSSKNGKQLGCKGRRPLARRAMQKLTHSPATPSLQNNKNNSFKINDSKTKRSPRNKTDSPVKLDQTLDSHNGISRYPKRCRNNISHELSEQNTSNNRTSPSKRRKVNNNTNTSNVDHAEVTESTRVSKTRSGRSQLAGRGARGRCASPAAALDAGGSRRNPSESPSKTLRQKKSVNKSVQSTAGRDSLRDKSGFAACFSDSDDDKPLKTQKFFC
ncbi:probable serine/threonine-protein kinase DDB_G0278845 [Plutella xylostella]|uniref:probable serine/threonine-protein kinase DDB_G0278845 n=1 Tax=Plutella xylostella TaxID=51655 RepID=UPI002032C985|nr:probable serine/threonine-protein kinase DDB_G0278845 [Plutella xylostella]